MNLGDILGGAKKDIGDVASKVIGVTNPSPVAQNFTKNLQHNLGDIGNYIGGSGPGPHLGGSILGTLGVGGGESGPAGPAAPPTNYWQQAFGPGGAYATTSNYDPNALLQFYQQTQGIDPTDKASVLKAIGMAQTAGYIQPAFEAKAQGQDALSQQAAFQNVIKPYLNNITNAEQTGANQTKSALQGIQSQYGQYESPSVKALLGTLDTSIEGQAGEDVQYANESALTSPAISQVLDMLRAQYINSLNNPQGTTTQAKLQAPSTLTAINNALTS